MGPFNAALNKLVYRCVPKLANESEFWRCYMCHAHLVLIACAPPEPPEYTLVFVGCYTTDAYDHVLSTPGKGIYCYVMNVVDGTMTLVQSRSMKLKWSVQS